MDKSFQVYPFLFKILNVYICIMTNLIRNENLLGGSKTLVGSLDSDLILQSLGKIYIQRGKSIKLFDDIIKALVNVSNDSIIITSDNDIEYPGDGKILFNKNNNILYITVDGQLIPLIEAQTKEGNYVKKSGDTMSGDLHLDKSFTIKSDKLIENLNANYLEGLTSKEFAQKNSDEIIGGEWQFDNNTTFKKQTTFEDTLTSPQFQSGFNGFGWRLDSKTNTLTIDNLIVRKVMKVFELVVNKIKATNGSLWVTNSSKIKNIYYFNTQLPKAKFIAKEGAYTYNKIQYNGKYFETINGVFPLPDSASLQSSLKYINTNLKVCTDNFETTGIYNTINIYNKYFNTNSFIIEVEDFVFDNGDLLTCQKLDSTRNIIQYDLLVISYLYNSGNSGFYLVQKSNDEIPQVGDALVQYGNIYNLDRQGSFYITSTEINSPFALVTDGANNPDYKQPYKRPIFTDNTETTVKQKDGKYLYEWIKFIKVRLGKLDGQWDEKYLDEHGNSTIKGWGLYGQNVYLTGKFHLNNGQSIIDFTQDNVLLKFKNAGLEIKDIGNNKQGIVMNADQIQILNNNVQTALFKDGYISADLIKAFKLESNKQIGGVSAWALNEDGSGHLAGDHITWDTNGNIKFKGEIETYTGKIANFVINNNFIGALDSDKHTYNFMLESNKLIYLERNIIGPHLKDKLVYIGMQFDDMTIDQLGRFEDTAKKAPDSKEGLFINIQGSIEENIAIDIAGGCIKGLRWAVKYIDNTIYLLSKEYNYLIRIIDQDRELQLPVVNQSDKGLYYIISNMSRNELHFITNDYVQYHDASNTDLTLDHYPTAFWYPSKIGGRTIKNDFWLRSGTTIRMVFTGLKSDNKFIWAVLETDAES